MGVSGQTVYPQERTMVLVEGWVDPRACLENFCGTEMNCWERSLQSKQVAVHCIAVHKFSSVADYHRKGLPYIIFNNTCVSLVWGSVKSPPPPHPQKRLHSKHVW